MRRIILAASVSLALVSGASAAGRPAGCPPVWCACWLRTQVATDPGPPFNLCRRWLTWGNAAGAVEGAIAILSRGKNPLHGHCGIVLGTDANGNPIIKSGNHNHAVGVATYPKWRVLGYRKN